MLNQTHRSDGHYSHDRNRSFLMFNYTYDADGFIVPALGNAINLTIIERLFDFGFNLLINWDQMTASGRIIKTSYILWPVWYIQIIVREINFQKKLYMARLNLYWIQKYHSMYLWNRKAFCQFFFYSWCNDKCWWYRTPSFLQRTLLDLNWLISFSVWF